MPPPHVELDNRSHEGKGGLVKVIEQVRNREGVRPSDPGSRVTPHPEPAAPSSLWGVTWGESKERGWLVQGTESLPTGPSPWHTVWPLYLWRGAGLGGYFGKRCTRPPLPCQADWVKNKTSPATALCQQGGR